MLLGGTYVLVSNPPATGTEIELIVSLSLGKVRARAVVRRSTPGKGMGLQFIQMSLEDRATLNQYSTASGRTYRGFSLR